MGDIHERCLNEWLMRSNNTDRCEICHEKYSKSGNILQPIWKWKKPNIELTVGSNDLIFFLFFEILNK